MKITHKILIFLKNNGKIKIFLENTMMIKLQNIQQYIKRINKKFVKQIKIAH